MPRPEGSLNVITQVKREVFSDAFIQLGGVTKLLEWAKGLDHNGDSNLRHFYNLFAKTLPREVKVDTSITLRTHEQFIEMMQMQKVVTKPVALIEVEDKNVT